ncbi:7-cyano-7-deazaguanine reductase [Gammaproteobacteria bacterium]|nr:7-cyano-7-deazaguanine reductase [Gammaproteobacteria bacterium]MDA9038967.1 7-cyano-7-deazaguanine reductase [Gammaproteobacteria bacterium]
MTRKHLGKATSNYSSASFKTLDPIPRALNSDSFGVDFWNAYEFTYLDKNNLPVLKVLEIAVPSNSKNIVESKSLKIYLNSFYKKKYKYQKDVLTVIKKDLDKITESSIKVRFVNKYINAPDSINLNNTKLKKTPSNKILLFTGFRSICPVTAQPDFANIYILTEAKIDISWLNNFLVSYKDKGDFHEQCIEGIFSEINKKYEPKNLDIIGRFMRRGGIDINPIRSLNKKPFFTNFRFFNQ